MFQIKLLTRNLVIILFSCSGIVVNINSYSVLAQTEASEPLAIPQNDPLLPPNNINRELSPLEKKRIKTEIETLEIEANSQLQQGQQKEAFTIWFRQLRLYRAISLSEEIIALGRVGEIAWQNNRGQELKVITQRLDSIYQEQKTNNNVTAKLLNILGTSAQQTRSLDKAIAIYNTLLTQARQGDNIQLEQQYLETIGKLYLDKFDYSQAANIYEELLTLNSGDITTTATEEYLSNLIDIYRYNKQPQKEIIVKKQLIDYYQAQEDNQKIAKLKVSLGDDYQTLGEIELAIQAYQEAIILGQSFQQIALTSETLTKLGRLYQRQEQYLLAIATYQQLLNVEKRAYNSYGVMNAYDRLGRLYLILENYEQAFTAFTQGLEIAQSLNYQVGYFTDLINQVEIKIK